MSGSVLRSPSSEEKDQLLISSRFFGGYTVPGRCIESMSAQHIIAQVTTVANGALVNTSQPSPPLQLQAVIPMDSADELMVDALHCGARLRADLPIFARQHVASVISRHWMYLVWMHLIERDPAPVSVDGCDRALWSLIRRLEWSHTTHPRPEHKQNRRAVFTVKQGMLLASLLLSDEDLLKKFVVAHGITPDALLSLPQHQLHSDNLRHLIRQLDMPGVPRPITRSNIKPLLLLPRRSSSASPDPVQMRTAQERQASPASLSGSASGTDDTGELNGRIAQSEVVQLRPSVTTRLRLRSSQLDNDSALSLSSSSSPSSSSSAPPHAAATAEEDGEESQQRDDEDDGEERGSNKDSEVDEIESDSEQSEDCDDDDGAHDSEPRRRLGAVKKRSSTGPSPDRPVNVKPRAGSKRKRASASPKPSRPVARQRTTTTATAAEELQPSSSASDFDASGQHLTSRSPSAIHRLRSITFRHPDVELGCAEDDTEHAILPYLCPSTGEAVLSDTVVAGESSSHRATATHSFDFRDADLALSARDPRKYWVLASDHVRDRDHGNSAHMLGLYRLLSGNEASLFDAQSGVLEQAPLDWLLGLGCMLVVVIQMEGTVVFVPSAESNESAHVVNTGPDKAVISVAGNLLSPRHVARLIRRHDEDGPTEDVRVEWVIEDDHSENDKAVEASRESTERYDIASALGTLSMQVPTSAVIERAHFYLNGVHEEDLRYQMDYYRQSWIPDLFFSSQACRLVSDYLNHHPLPLSVFEQLVNMGRSAMVAALLSKAALASSSSSSHSYHRQRSHRPALLVTSHALLVC